MQTIEKPAPFCCLIPPETIREHWQAVYREMIGAALDHSQLVGENTGSVYERLAEGSAFLAQIADADTLYAVAVLEIAETSSGQVLHVHTLTGEDMAVWLAELSRWLEQVAEGLGCVGVSCTGRLGWQKTLAKLGYEPLYITMRKGI